MMLRRTWPLRFCVRTASRTLPCQRSHSSSGAMAMKQRKNTISPVGNRSARTFTPADISVKASAERTLSPIPR